MQLKTTTNTGADTGNIPTNEGPSASCHNATIRHLFCLSIVPGYPNLEPESQILFSPKNQGKSSYFPLTPSPPTRKAACLNPSKPFLNDTHLYPTLIISSTAKNRMDPSQTGFMQLELLTTHAYGLYLQSTLSVDTV